MSTAIQDITAVHGTLGLVLRSLSHVIDEAASVDNDRDDMPLYGVDYALRESSEVLKGFMEHDVDDPEKHAQAFYRLSSKLEATRALLADGGGYPYGVESCELASTLEIVAPCVYGIAEEHERRAMENGGGEA